MTEKCNPKYKNLNEIQSYSEQKYATVEWAEQNCMNDEYLKQEVDELNYKSPARIRKRWKPPLVDDENSYGYQISTNNDIRFSNKTSIEFLVDFEDMSYVDMKKSDCDFRTFKDESNTIHRCATIPHKVTMTSNTDCRDWRGEGINSFWYVGFDKNKQYHIRPDWIKDYKDLEIPSVCRAQTITIPDSVGNDGILYSVDLRIENNGTTNSNWGSPLYVQLRKTEAITVEKTKWDGKKKKGVSYYPKQYETIYVPSGGAYDALATATYDPSRISPGLQNLVFDKKVHVKAGEHYALVFMSPLSHWEHCPRIGGWGRNCDTDKYTGGDAFLSENNGYTWERYGKMDLTLREYRMGQYTPLDFVFICHIGIPHDGYDNEEDFYLYLKPIHANPIKSIQLVPVGYGNEPQLTNMDMEFQVSQSGRANSWVTLNPQTLKINFNKDGNTGEYPHFAYIRVKMSTESTTVAPYLDSMNVIVKMDVPKEMYVRTIKYNPKVAPMLGASAWSKFGCNFETDPQVTGSVELISEKIGTEHFQIVTAKELENYTWIKGLDAEKLTANELSDRYQYLMDDINALKILKANNIYVKPYTYTKNGVTKTDKMSFRDELGGGIQFSNSPAYPIIEGVFNPMNNQSEIPITEWIDYSFDYDNDILKFNEVMNTYTENGHTVEEGIAEYLSVGTLAISYHPILIQDLTIEDVGIRENDEGFVLDYFKEIFIINNNDIENRYIQLKTQSCDPIRELRIGDDEYIEDIHFTVDYLNNRIEFPVIDAGQSSTLLNENLGKELSVVYTPNFEDTGLIIAYRGIRTNTGKQMRIKENYIEYKV